MATDSFLVVGLGNPGPEYEKNRHNVGFLFLDYCARRLSPAGWQGRNKFAGELMDVRFQGARHHLFKPLSYMNLSGGPTSRASSFFKIPAERVLVCYDDVSLPFGSLRLREKGSAGGQKGLKDILKALGTDQVPRMRFGIGSSHAGKNLSQFVLSDFSRAESQELEEIFELGYDALMALVTEGVTKAGSRYNRTLK